MRSQMGSVCTCLGALRVLTAPAFSPKLCPDVKEYSSQVMRVNFPLYGLMEVKVTISTICHLMERRFIILIEKTFDIRCGKLANAPLAKYPS